MIETKGIHYMVVGDLQIDSGTNGRELLKLVLQENTHKRKESSIQKRMRSSVQFNKYFLSSSFVFRHYARDLGYQEK